MNNFIALILVLTSILSYAQTETSTDTVPTEGPSSPEFTFGISLETTSFIYKEPLMKQSGTMNGFNLLEKYRKNSVFALNANLHYLKGKLEYDGALMNGTPIKSEDTYEVLDIAANGYST